MAPVFLSVSLSNPRTRGALKKRTHVSRGRFLPAFSESVPPEAALVPRRECHGPNRWNARLTVDPTYWHLSRRKTRGLRTRRCSGNGSRSQNWNAVSENHWQEGLPLCVILGISQTASHRQGPFHFPEPVCCPFKQQTTERGSQLKDIPRALKAETLSYAAVLGQGSG